MNCKVALFDVDGTIINGNCTDIFVEYIFDYNLTDVDDFKYYFFLKKKYLPTERNHLSLAQEAFKILSKIEFTKLKSYWEDCYHNRIKNRIIDRTVAEIDDLKSKQLDIFLASGSPKFMILAIGEAFGIPDDRLIATDFQCMNNYIISESADPICIGDGKMKASLSLFEAKGIPVDSVRFYSDNISDLGLLSMTGCSYWMGSNEDYLNYHMDRRGIKKMNFSEGEMNGLPYNSQPLEKDLSVYYMNRKPWIEESIFTIFPVTSSIESLNYLIGDIYGQFDINTLQKAFFDPVTEYIMHQKKWMISLGTCILLDAGGLNIDQYIPIIGISEFLNISHLIFRDIIQWISGEKPDIKRKSYTEISIFGNASLALLTLPAHIFLFNRIDLEEKKKLRFYELYTFIVFDGLFGNGIKLYQEQQEAINSRIDEYYKIAKLVNRGIFQYPFYMYLILADLEEDCQLVQHIDRLLDNIAILIQLGKDLNSYRRWLQQGISLNTNPFIMQSNILCIHAAKMLPKTEVNAVKNSRKHFENILLSEGSFDFIHQTILDYTDKVRNGVENLPFEDKYKQLLLLYIDFFKE